MYKTSLFIFLTFLTQLSADYINHESFLEYKKNYNLTKNLNSTVDIYDFFYLPSLYKCELRKNNLIIDTFDKRFSVDRPIVRGYKCPAWIKEHYTDCKILKNYQVSAVTLGYGKYERTNFLLAFNPLYDNMKANIKVECKR